MRRHTLALLALALNLGLLLPGLFLPVLTIIGNLEPAGIAHVAPPLLEAGISDSAIKSFKPMLNPLATAMLGDDAKLRDELLKRLTPQIVESLSQSAQPVEVYRQSRSILGSVQHLYEIGGYLAATLILVFSVIVPIGKIALMVWAYVISDAQKRQRIDRVLAAIKKRSMADVLAVALFITYLAARATQEPPAAGEAPSLVTFDALFGSGFYWFTAYCVFSIATHQVRERLTIHLT